MLEEVSRRLYALSHIVLERFQLKCRPMDVKHFDDEIDSS